MKILFASDSFKGSLTSMQISNLLKQATSEIFPNAQTVSMSVADGGEGTMDSLVNSLGGTWKTVDVLGPLQENIKARYGILPEGKAIIEMAEASGLPLVPSDKRNPQKTTSYGTGMLIRDALENGITDITIAIGGSATNDGGMGAMQALGIKFLDENNNELTGCGENLSKVKNIDLDNLHHAVAKTNFTVMCDVTNPLLGNQGATYTFGHQKGADDTMLAELEYGMSIYANKIKSIIGKDISGKEGSGAAGGLGFALMAFLGAKLQSGIDVVLDLLDFDKKLKDVDLVITGEGRMDNQSAFGKVPSGIGKRCKKMGVPAVAIVGGLLSGYESIYNCGIESVTTTINGAMTIDEALANSEDLYLDAARRLLRMIRCGKYIFKENI